MPSLKMKTKSTTGCRKEKNGLHVSRKSSVISKDHLSHGRVSKNAEEIPVSIPTGQDVYDRVHAQDLGKDEANHDSGRDEVNEDESSSESKVFQKQSSALTDSATDSMEPMLSTCASNIETIFSPILDSIDFNDHGGSDHLYVPQLDTEDSDDSSRSSCEYQACNVSDFYISDMIFSGAPTESNSEFDNKTDTVFLPDYKFEGSSLLCDLTEEYLAMPFLEEKNLGAGHEFDGGRPPQETSTDVDNASLYSAIHQLRPCNQESHINAYTDQEYECFDPQMYIRSLPDQSDMEFTPLSTSTTNDKQNTKRITLVLDLDETLVHSTLEHSDDADFTFSVFFNLKEHTVYVKQRPHLQAFLKRVAEMFEIVVFTASQSIYAKQLLDILDPDGNLISKRAYRESCIFSEGTYMKDLTVLGVDLAKVVIIDNSPQVFRLQVNNGIPIKSWFDDPSDCALIALLPFLESLVDAEDVRPIIARKFGNKE